MSSIFDNSVTFRFLKLDKLQALTLSHEIKDASYCQHADGHFIGCVDLDEIYFEDLITFFVRQQILLTDCDILISISSSRDSDTYTTPNVVNKMLKHIDCPLTFSYTCIEL